MSNSNMGPDDSPQIENPDNEVRNYLADKDILKSDRLFSSSRLRAGYASIDRVGAVLKGTEGHGDHPVQRVKRSLENFILNKSGINSIPSGNSEVPLRKLVKEAMMEQYLEQATRNVSALKNEGYLRYVRSESAGGNAGHGMWEGKDLPKIATHIYFDRDGRIAEYGNNSKLQGQKGYKQADFYHFYTTDPNVPFPGLTVDEVVIDGNEDQERLHRLDGEKNDGRNRMAEVGMFKQDMVIALTAYLLTQDQKPSVAKGKDPQIFVAVGTKTDADVVPMEFRLVKDVLRGK
jgi:hypothetical protein